MSEINSVSELQLQMEKVGVLLSLSSLESLLDSTGLVVKLFSNIISSPEESKFRSIKVSNEQINRRLIQRKGCVELLQACQWKSEAKDGVNHIKMAKITSEAKIFEKVSESGLQNYSQNASKFAPQ